MASICILILTVTIISIGNAATEDFSTVKCKNKMLGHYGHESLLECVVETPNDDTNIKWITWRNGSHIVLSVRNNNNNIITQLPGYWYDPPSSWTGRTMTVYLRIQKNEFNHSGSYEVIVWTDRGRCSDSITLQVTAKYKKPTITEAMNSNKVRTLKCESDGGFPEGKLGWFDGHEELMSSSPMETTQSENGLFHLVSMLTVEGGSSEANYSCTVFNFSGGRELETHFPVLDSAKTEEMSGPHQEPNLHTKIAAPLVVIGSLIVGLLLLVLYRRRSQMARRQSTAPLMGDHVEVPTENNGGISASHDPNHINV